MTPDKSRLIRPDLSDPIHHHLTAALGRMIQASAAVEGMIVLCLTDDLFGRAETETQLNQAAWVEDQLKSRASGLLKSLKDYCQDVLGEAGLFIPLEGTQSLLNQRNRYTHQQIWVARAPDPLDELSDPLVYHLVRPSLAVWHRKQQDSFPVSVAEIDRLTASLLAAEDHLLQLHLKIAQRRWK